MMSEILTCIKLIKVSAVCLFGCCVVCVLIYFFFFFVIQMYAWEIPFTRAIQRVRNEERAILQKSGLVQVHKNNFVLTISEFSFLFFSLVPSLLVVHSLFSM